MYMSKGNIKVKANIFNLPSKITCKACLECHKYCYAAKAERLYPSVLPNRKNNLFESKRDSFVESVVYTLRKRENKLVRIHESGDFYSKEYVLKWFEIMKQLPEYTFYAFTKRNDVFKYIRSKPSNFTLILSADGVDSKPIKKAKIFDKTAIVSSTETNCTAQIIKGALCGVDCFKCIDKKGPKTIIFKKH